MEKGSEQMVKKDEHEEKKQVEEGLPVKTSPYLQYSNLEDYKQQGYGTDGHQQVKPNQGGGGTDAPTLSGYDFPHGVKPAK